MQNIKKEKSKIAKTQKNKPYTQYKFQQYEPRTEKNVAKVSIDKISFLENHQMEEQEEKASLFFFFFGEEIELGDSSKLLNF